MSVPTVQLRLFGAFGVLAGKNKDDVMLPASSTVYSLLRGLSDVYGKDFRDELFSGACELNESFAVMINGAIIDPVNAGEIYLNPGDDIALLPVFMGGG